MRWQLVNIAHNKTQTIRIDCADPSDHTCRKVTDSPIRQSLVRKMVAYTRRRDYNPTHIYPDFPSQYITAASVTLSSRKTRSFEQKRTCNVVHSRTALSHSTLSATSLLRPLTHSKWRIHIPMHALFFFLSLGLCVHGVVYALKRAS